MVFGQARVWDTAENNGVLIYLLLADRAVEIVADRGLRAHAGPAQWEAICRCMEAAFREGRYADGLCAGVDAVTELLVQAFPAGAQPSPNELPNQLTFMR